MTNQQTKHIAPTWQQLAQLEPRLEYLLKEAKAVKAPSGKSFCANQVWYGSNERSSFKVRLIKLVGWNAEKKDPVLNSAEAYDLAYNTVYNALPPCRKCTCE